jgi:chaperonin cofactor prefoldin
MFLSELMRVALPSCRYKMGEIFVEVSKDEAEQLLEKATSKLSEVASVPISD